MSQNGLPSFAKQQEIVMRKSIIIEKCEMKKMERDIIMSKYKKRIIEEQSTEKQWRNIKDVVIY